MGNSCGRMRHSSQLKVSDPVCGMGESTESEFLTAQVTQTEHGSLSCESFLSAQCESIGEGMDKSLMVCGESGIKEEIERSKRHWSLLADPLEFGDVEEGVVAEVDNVEVLRDLKSHPTLGNFFTTCDVEGSFGGGIGELVVGEKFAEGGQAELYHAQVIWKHELMAQADLELGREWVLKVFTKGTFLRRFLKQMPHGYFHAKVEYWNTFEPLARKVFPRYYCEVMYGILLADGRFAFLMLKEHFDLRSLIERNSKISEDCRPFSHDDAQWLMYNVALGMNWLHEHHIVHRDLKAANVLVKENNHMDWPFKYFCCVADYDCSVGVVGTGFFRAPKIFQAIKDKELSKRPEVFSKAADVYSYGMTCYEILTGKLPFEDHCKNDYDRVLLGPQFVVPGHVDDWTRSLLSRCWQLNLLRPSMKEIVNLFLDHSPRVRETEVWINEQFREFREQ